jgi:hypothetical protein
MENPDQPAFTANGLTKREYAAFLMMTVLVSARGTRDGADLAKSAVKFADNILAELAKPTETN